MKDLKSHSLNLVKIDDKWYYIDITNSINDIYYKKYLENSFLGHSFNKNLEFISSFYTNDKKLEKFILDSMRENNVELKEQFKLLTNFNYANILKSIIKSEDLGKDKVLNVFEDIYLEPEFIELSEEVIKEREEVYNEYIKIENEINSIKYIKNINSLLKLYDSIIMNKEKILLDKYKIILSIEELKELIKIKNENSYEYIKIKNLFKNEEFLSKINILEIQSNYTEIENNLIKEVFSYFIENLNEKYQSDSLKMHRYKVIKNGTDKYRKLYKIKEM